MTLTTTFKLKSRALEIPLDDVMHYVYVLKSLKDKKYYIGSTSNVMMRLSFHNEGLNVSTKSRKPFALIFKKEFKNKPEALKFEKLLKKQKGGVGFKKLILLG